MSKHWHSNPTQVYWTCDALLNNRTICHRDEIGEANGWRLSSIVHNLRSRYDWPIETEYRGPERIAYYSLSKTCDRQRLKWPRSARPLSAPYKASEDD